MAEKSKREKETRIMKVTMDADEFEKYDKGETHSDSGLRNEAGRLSALPDIAPISDDDLPQVEIVKTETVYVQPAELTTGERVGSAVGDFACNVIADVINDPEIQEMVGNLLKAIWKYKVSPKIEGFIQRIKGENKPKAAPSSPTTKWKTKAEAICEGEKIGEKQNKIVVTTEEANQLLAITREESRKLAAMIYLLSNICIKDSKTDEDLILEKSYIKQLVSDEATNTMRMLLDNRQLLDESTAICFSDFLDGYLRNGNQKIPIPQILDESV